MKKFIVFLGLALLLTGIRLSDNGLLALSANGKFTVYGRGGVETVYAEKPLLDRFDGYTRLDISGTLAEAEKGLKELSAKAFRTEEVDGITVIYAYSPLIKKHETVFGRRVNVMVAVGGGKIAFGCPLLKGSY